jgi:hypothetical protein
MDFKNKNDYDNKKILGCKIEGKKKFELIKWKSKLNKRKTKKLNHHHREYHVEKILNKTVNGNGKSLFFNWIWRTIRKENF